MELPLKQKLFYFFPVLFCFCLPFGSLILSAIVVAWTAVSLFNIDKQLLVQGLKNKNLLFFYIFFFLTLISALFSSNKGDSLFAVEIKMTFLLFPYLLFCFHWPIEILRRCVISFVSGCFFACLYLIIRAFFYTMSGEEGYFYYTLFSDFIHTSSFSMYLVLAITFVILFYHNWFKTQRSVIYSSYFFVSIFIASIFLCSSKLGLISFFICVPLVTIYRFKNHLRIRGMAFLSLGIIVSISVVVMLFPGLFSRMSSLTNLSVDNLDKTSAESTTVRVLIWREATHIIEENFLLGTGVGDANDELYNAYQKNGLSGALDHRLNAHNQFLQTFIGLGIVGFLSLALITLGLMVKAIFKRNFILFLFSLLIILNFLVESMLQRSDGTLFFTFFYCFFNLVGENQLADG
jgi:O-antigen ligase